MPLFLMRFLVDEYTDPDVAEWLRNQKHEVLLVIDYCQIIFSFSHERLSQHPEYQIFLNLLVFLSFEPQRLNRQIYQELAVIYF